MLKVRDINKLKDYGFESFAGVYNLELTYESDINTESEIDLIVNKYDDKQNFVDDHILRIYTELTSPKNNHNLNQTHLTAELDVVFKMIQDGVVYIE